MTKIRCAVQKKTRLDVEMFNRGMAQSRTRAQDLISSGFVEVDGYICLKASTAIRSHNIIHIRQGAPDYVSRGAVKLTAALEYFKFPVQGHYCLDVGASTGGFTDILLQKGARHILAIDVGHKQLHPSLRLKPEVTYLEGFDARKLTPEVVGIPVEAVVIDVSFISIIKILPFIIPLISCNCWLIFLVKPQFEVGLKHIKKNGIVTNAAVRELALTNTVQWLVKNTNLKICGTLKSPISGGSGNQEYLVGACQID
ncbi:MAG: TlyA family RNA methyltransferase [Hyphomicrobiaceae bacterium]|nr:TlyA family RNA methyltransferase [Hyphomicrobiaceae bacterium]